jgi:hypothetical protein
MRPLRILMAATLVAAGAAAQAAGGHDTRPVAAAQPPADGALASAASRQLRQDDVPSVTTDPASVKAKADADMAARDARAKGPRLQVRRENLKGDQAARAMQRQTNPNTIDHDTAYGDKDHTQQVTDLKISVKK